MSLNDTPRSERVHIALFGMRNAGKSSIINALTNQEIAIVSKMKGTTTDPVYKAMEILPIGPCVIIDTAGLDDVGELGELRKKKIIEVLNKTNIALVVIDTSIGLTDYDKSIIDQVRSKKIPVIAVLNKVDKALVNEENITEIKQQLDVPCVSVSAVTKQGIKELKDKIISLIPEEEEKFKITLDRGLKLLNTEIANIKTNKILPGNILFKLYL